ncbi:SDR family NAD(P)-dependent oxidoreductase [Roseiterribacter gracilis]|uniref:Oxidoreductase n=1 Tax=Roseiterribacter gracilis TaxID=2812848 RepID=A0A8S8XE25_9PROT|nr:oxidoreductase [Rhodospirillales bacterium TMPK1]
MAKTLTGKVAIVTGGARGIGAAVAKRLGADGADVAISYSASADQANAVVQELKAKGVRAVAIKADASDPKQAAKLISDVVAQFGKLDILVNNAGVYAPGAVGDAAADTAALDRQRVVNYDSVVAGIRAAAPVISDGGRIITIGSCLGQDVRFPGIADYAATKFAVAGYSRGAARDLGPRNITVNVVQPGPIDTDMNPADGEHADGQRAALALNRYGKPEDIAAGVAFLAGPEASFITGTTLSIDGGFGA